MKTEKIEAYYDGNRTHVRWLDGKGYRYHIWLKEDGMPIEDGMGEVTIFKNKTDNTDYRFRTRYLKGSVPINTKAINDAMAFVQENDLISIAIIKHIEREKAQVEAYRHAAIARLKGEAAALGFDLVARE